MTANLETCYLCARPIPEDQLDAEHVFPQNLFEKGDRSDLIKLPAHRACNSSYSKDDDYFRLCITGASYEDVKAKNLWQGPVLRGVHRPESAKYKSYILDNLKDVELRSEAGRILGDSTVMLQDANRLQRVVCRMAKGLHGHLTTDILPEDWPVSCDLVNPAVRTDPGWSKLYDNPRSIGNGTVRFVHKYHPDDNRDAFFWIVFYDTVDFWAFIGTKVKGAIDDAIERVQKRHEGPGTAVSEGV